MSKAAAPWSASSREALLQVMRYMTLIAGAGQFLEPLVQRCATGDRDDTISTYSPDNGDDVHIICVLRMIGSNLYQA